MPRKNIVWNQSVMIDPTFFRIPTVNISDTKFRNDCLIFNTADPLTVPTVPLMPRRVPMQARVFRSDLCCPRASGRNLGKALPCALI